MDGVTPKFTKQELLFKKYDARTIKIEDIEVFCEVEGIEFVPDTGKKITENLTDLAKIVRKSQRKPKKVEESKTETVSVPDKPVPEKKKDPHADLPGYSRRRMDKIKKEQATLNAGSADNPIHYGENAPGFLKHRFGGEG